MKSKIGLWVGLVFLCLGGLAIEWIPDGEEVTFFQGAVIEEERSWLQGKVKRIEKVLIPYQIDEVRKIEILEFYPSGFLHKRVQGDKMISGVPRRNHGEVEWPTINGEREIYEIVSSVIYDEKGRVIQSHFWDEPERKYRYEGNQRFTSIDGKEKKVSLWVILKRLIWEKPEKIFKAEYNSAGQIMKGHTTLDEYAIYEYTDQGQYKKWTYYSLNGDVRGTRIFTYDEQGNLLKEHEEKWKGKSEVRYEYLEFDAYGNWTKRKKYIYKGWIEEVRKIEYFE